MRIFRLMVVLVNTTLLGGCDIFIVDTDDTPSCGTTCSTTSCSEGHRYCYNACGERLEMLEYCLYGCTYDQCEGEEPDECADPCADIRCDSGDLYCYDNCGDRQSVYQYCSDGCSNDACIDCSPDCSSTQCYDGDVYCYNGCGNRTAVYEYCDGECSGGQCGCAADQFTCYDDSCISQSWVCDCEYDCPYGEDEQGCSFSRTTAYVLVIDGCDDYYNIMTKVYDMECDGEVFPAPDTHWATTVPEEAISVQFDCITGHQICLGAANEDRSSWWGIDFDGTNPGGASDLCCTTCGEVARFYSASGLVWSGCS